MLRFRTNLGEFLSSLGEFSLKVAGVDFSAKRKQAEAAAALAAAVVSRTDGGATPRSAAIAAEAVTPSVIKSVERSTVLWVDDHPDNNIYERQALETLGISFVLVTSTEEALEKLKQQRFDLIISDMARASDSRAGYTLLDKLRSSGDRTPFIIYASSRAPEHVAEAKRRGAIGCTNRPDELFEMVLFTLGHKA